MAAMEKRQTLTREEAWVYLAGAYSMTSIGFP